MNIGINNRSWSCAVVILMMVSSGRVFAENPTLRDPLELGFQLATRIPVKPHIADRSKSQYTVLKAAIDLGDVDAVGHHATKIANWRFGMICGDLARHYLHAGDVASSQSWQEQALASTEKITGFNKDWQTRRVLGNLAAVQYAADLENDARSTTRRLEFKDSMEIQKLHYSRIDSDGAYERSMEALAKMGESKHWEVQFGVAETYILILKNLGESHTDEQYNTLVERVQELATKLPTLMAFSLNLSLADTVRSVTGGQAGIELLNSIATSFDGRKLNNRFDIPNMAKLATALDQAGQQQKAAALLARAAELLSADSMQPLDFCAASLAMSKAYAARGDADMAHAGFDAAMNTAMKQRNGRIRYIALVDLCVAVAESGLEMKPRLVQSLNVELNKKVKNW